MNLLAIALALAFWAPYTADHKPPCSGGLEITTFTAAEQPGWGGASYLNDGCHIQVLDNSATWPIRGQCAMLAHEIGHAVFGLEHADDPDNIMHSPAKAPAICQLPERYDEWTASRARFTRSAQRAATHQKALPAIKRPRTRRR